MSDTAQTSREGSRFGPYLLRRLLNSDESGAVYEALDTVNDSVVALKLLSPTLSDDPDFCERMQHDLRAAERLDEPHLLPINDHGEINGEWFVDMRLIEGVDLATLIRESRELAPPRAVTVIGQVAAALDSLHAAGIEHGEITPTNIVATSNDFVYVGGLGVGEAATAGGVSPADNSAERWKYVAPERLTDADIDYRVDIYALACVLYECLTGLPPYRADDADKMIAAHLSNPIPRASQLRPDVPPSFDEVIAIGMAKDPRQRYFTAGQLALAAYQALSRAEQGLVRHFTPPPAALRSPPAAILPPPHAASGAMSAPPLPVPHYPPAPPQAGSGYPIGPQPGHAPPAPPAGGAWPGQFAAPPVSYNRPRRRRRRRVVLGAMAAIVVLAAAAVGLHFLVRASEPTPAAPATVDTPTASTTTTPTTPAAVAQARLFGQLPTGYPPGVCRPTAAPEPALAQVACDQNVDPDGPPAATYTMYPDVATLRSAFDRAVPASAVIICPGRIQSPGPWHHVASPDKPSGMVLCAAPQGNPSLTWTNDAELMLSTVQASVPGPTIDQLFAWWSSHS